MATTYPVANVRVLPFGPNPPFPAFTGDVTLLKESIDPQLLTDIGLTTDDILFQFSSQITGDPVTWGYDNSIQPMETVNNSGTSNSSYATVSLQVYLKRHPIRSGSFSIQIRGESDDGKVANATLTINVDKGTAGVKEQ